MTHHNPTDDRLSTLESRVENLESRFETIERVFSSEIIEKADAHAAACQEDPRQQFEIGDTHDVVISDMEQDYNGKTGVGKIDGVVTFIDPTETEIETGDVATVRITDVKENALEAMALSRS
ncbi:TRAM domain-containing protein (plasmid) [Haloarcula sp. NS06]|uniref:TRAM domain-containing protein n=1 Tax=Haloarcula sp. NS06 TaxID=3409688 RepID=UPI003DA6F4BE